MEKGRVILLNGVSSSGKTTIAKALQEKLQEPYYWFSIDTFCNMVSTRYFDGSIDGKVLNQICRAFHHTIRSFSDMGMHCIVDTLFLNAPGIDGNLRDFVRRLHGNQVLIVYVHCPLEELQNREKKRGDRMIGQAESQLALLQPKDIFDIAIDTFVNTTDECVNQIIEAADSPQRFTAFDVLCREFV